MKLNIKFAGQALLLGFVFLSGVALHYFLITNALTDKESFNEEKNNIDAKKPLYWVAPMDANYRRDKPGKSPMGMDLIPVYDDAINERALDIGVVSVAPEMINNLSVRTAVASMQSLNQQIKAVGVLQYDQEQIVHIHPRVEGWVHSLFVKTTGTVIVKGQSIYSLYSPALVSVQEEYLLALKQNNSRLMAAAEERLAALKLPARFIADLKQDRRVIQSVIFYAEQSGVVENLNIREGFYVQPGTAILSIANLHKLWLEASVFERDSGLIAVGQTATISVDYLPRKIGPLKVDYIYPSLAEANRTLRVRFRLDNSELLLKPNMFATVIFDGAKKTPSLVVPREAVIRLGDKNKLVLALGDGRFKSVAVTVGQSDAYYTEILAGINAGQRIVTSAQFLLDSESSKTSDFINDDIQQITLSSNNAKQAGSVKSAANRAQVRGVVNSVNQQQKTVNISREAITQWNRPAATLDFNVADNIDMATFVTGQSILFTFEINSGVFNVINVDETFDVGRVNIDAAVDDENVDVEAATSVHGGQHD